MVMMIAAKTAKSNIIGMGNTLPWKQKNDMQRFKSITVGKMIVMGRKTFESFGAKALPHRRNVVITRDEQNLKLIFSVSDNILYATPDKVINMANYADNIVIIGGEQIYKEFMGIATVLYITDIHAPEDLQGDAFFPEIDMTVWKLFAKESYKADEHNQYDYDFLTYVRK